MTKTELALSTKIDRCRRHVCLCNPCARAESHQQERAQKLGSATLNTFYLGLKLQTLAHLVYFVLFHFVYAIGISEYFNV